MAAEVWIFTVLGSKLSVLLTANTAKSQRTATCVCFYSPCKALTMQNVFNIAGRTVQSKKADDCTSPSCWYIGLEADCVLHLVPFGKCYTGFSAS